MSTVRGTQAAAQQTKLRDRCAVVWKSIILVVLAASSTSVVGDSPGSVVFTRSSPSIVKVEHGGWGEPTVQGSGVVVGRDLVATNCHVLAGARRIDVIAGKERVPGNVQYRDVKGDLCLLHVPGLAAPPAPIITTALPAVGTRVFAIGAPLGLDLTLSEGIVSALREGKSGKVIQTTVALSPGSSGGGLFNETGALVGITSSQLRAGQNLNFALPVGGLRRWIDAYQAARDGAKIVIRSARYPPHVSISIEASDGRKTNKVPSAPMLNRAKPVADGVRLTSNDVATICSALGAGARAPEGGRYVVWNGNSVSFAPDDWLVHADPLRNVCIIKSTAHHDQIPTISVGQTQNIRVGDAVFSFTSAHTADEVRIGIVEKIEKTRPTNVGYLLEVESNPTPSEGSGVFTRDGRLIGMVMKRVGTDRAVVLPVESVMAVFEDAYGKPK